MTTYEKFQLGKLDSKTTKRSIIDYCEIFRAFKHERSHGAKYIEAVEIAAEGMNVSTRTVKRAISIVNR